MTTTHFIFRQSTSQEQQGSICMRVTHQRNTQSITLPSKIYSHEWDWEKERSNNQTVNQEIEQAHDLVNKIVAELSLQGAYKAKEVLLRYRCLTKAHSLESFVYELKEELLAQNQARTARSYQTAVERLCDFCNNPELPLSGITATLMSDFDRHLFAEGLARNTISSYMRTLRAIYNKAVEMQLIVAQTIPPFKNVFTGVEPTRKRALNSDEMNRLAKIDVRGNDKLFFALQLFLFGFHAKGMSFVDMAYLKKSDLRGNTIRYRRKKTKGLIELKINPSLREIINYFAPMTQNSPYLLPIITSKDKDERLQYESALRLQNKRLNALGKLAKLPYPLSTHVCRHSWASLAKQINTPLAVISDSLGHSSQKTTQIYLASIGQDVLDKVSERVSQLVQSPSRLNNYPLGNYPL